MRFKLLSLMLTAVLCFSLPTFGEKQFNFEQEARLRATLRGHTDFVSSIAFSPNGQILASGSWDNTIILWDVATAESVKILRGHTDRVLSVAFSPDGRTLASGSDDQTIRLWDVAARQQRDILRGHTSGITAVSLRLMTL